MFDERKCLEILQACVTNEGHSSYLWQDMAEPDSFWSLSVGGFEVVMDNDEYVAYIEDANEVLRSRFAMEVAIFFNHQ